MDSGMSLTADEQWIDQRLQETTERMQEFTRDSQTELLRGLEGISNSFAIRMRAVEADISNVRTAEQLRLAGIEERLAALEIKVLGQRRDNKQ